MNKVKLTICCLLLFLVNICWAQEVTLKYIRKHSPLAADLSQQWGIPSSIILGVSILESGSGTSINCKQLNNYFGVKGRNHLKKRHTKYKQYASAQESFEDFCGILSRKKFYPKMKGNMDYHLWLKHMNQSKYSSAQEVWVHRIKLIISKYKLYKLDEKSGDGDHNKSDDQKPTDDQKQTDQSPKQTG
jgi:flagellum-specific peptidoglycan hydrolase FlgJ